MAYPFYGWMNIWIDSDTYININIIKRCPFLLITWNNWIFWISWNFLLLTNYWNQLNCWAFESSTSLQFLVFRAFLFSFKLKIFQQIKNCFYPQIFQLKTKVVLPLPFNKTFNWRNYIKKTRLRTLNLIKQYSKFWRHLLELRKLILPGTLLSSVLAAQLSLRPSLFTVQEVKHKNNKNPKDPKAKTVVSDLRLESSNEN